MKTIEYMNPKINKVSWGEGPWFDEPDKKQWQDADTGLPCLAVRHGSSGHWCGYVGVTEGHKAFRVHYDSVNAYAHGGLTFSAPCDPAETRESGICHLPEPGESDHVWWLGFDCAHSSDYQPAMWGYSFCTRDCYKSLEFVETECRDLAQQLHAMT
jgi:hypothetical protein